MEIVTYVSALSIATHYATYRAMGFSTLYYLPESSAWDPPPVGARSSGFAIPVVMNTSLEGSDTIIYTRIYIYTVYICDDITRKLEKKITTKKIITNYVVNRNNVYNGLDTLCEEKKQRP